MNVEKFFETLAKIVSEKNEVNIKVEVKKNDNSIKTSNRSIKRNKAV